MFNNVKNKIVKLVKAGVVGKHHVETEVNQKKWCLFIFGSCYKDNGFGL